MKYTCQLILKLPRERIAEIFDDPGNIFEWQEGLEACELIEGEPGRPGGKSRLLYNIDGRVLEMIETVTVWNPPDEMTAVYEAGKVWNEVKNLFYVNDENSTLWICANEFRVRGFYKIIFSLFPGTCRKQTEKYMNDFKAYAESL